MTENSNVYCAEIRLLPQVPAAICVLWGGGSGAPGLGGYSRGITNPLLVCSAAAIQQNKIILVTA